MPFRRSSIAGLLLLTALASGCVSRDQKAATAAGIAADALGAGQIGIARMQIARAIAARDDNSDYWLLSGRIALAANDYGGAYNAFENALTLDRGNDEALSRICQLALSTGQPERAERYVDQLLTLHPGNHIALNLQATLALLRGDKAGAARLLGQVLKADPADPQALLIRSHLLAADEDYAGAAQVAEQSLTAPGDPSGRLTVLRDYYLKAHDAGGYGRTLARLARANPGTVDPQLDYAHNLFEAGEPAAACAVTRAVLATHPGDLVAAERVLNLWLAQDAKAVPVAAMVADTSAAALETRATIAQYANARGRPDLALRVLGDAAPNDPATAATNDAKAARASAQARLGDRAGAQAGVAAVLAADPDQPRALVVRAGLRAVAGDRRGAVEDLRHALAGAPANASARLQLADLLLADGDGVLAISALNDGLSETGADPRLAARLAALLRARGRADQAAGVVADYARQNPFAPRLR